MKSHKDPIRHIYYRIFAGIICTLLILNLENSLCIEYLNKKSTEYNKNLEMKTFDFDIEKIKKKVKDKKDSIKGHIKENIEARKNPPAPLSKDDRKNTYAEIEKELNLTAVQKFKFYTIMQDEKKVLEPLVLEYMAKQERYDELVNIKCNKFDFNCKKEKEKKIENIEFELKEAKRQIRIKKEYYMILYRNVLTREQGLILDEVIHDSAMEKIQ